MIDAEGMPVPNSHVVEIAFPGDTIETMLGPVRPRRRQDHRRRSPDTRRAVVPRDREALLGRNTIKDASEQSLILVIEGHEKSVRWSVVTGVSAGRAKLDRNSQTWILLLAFEMEWTGKARLLLVGEVEPAWLPLTTFLHVALPEIAPFEVSRVRAAAMANHASTRTIRLYDRRTT